MDASQLVKFLVKFGLGPCFRIGDRRLPSAPAELTVAPVFVLGPPRSGTTLAYLALASRFRFAYLCNAANSMYGGEATASRFFQRRVRTYQTDFSSTYGKTEGHFAPSEAEDFWKHWFPRDERPIGRSFETEAPAGTLRSKIHVLQKIFDAPFLNKSVHHTSRLPVLDRILPESCYVILSRDVRDTAYSILRTRRNRHERLGDPLNQWWSVKPRGWETLAAGDPVQQVCGQVVGTLRDLTDYRETLGPERFFSLRYEELCRDPRNFARRFRDFYAARGGSLEDRGELPESFGYSTYEGVDGPDLTSIRDFFEEQGA